MQGRLFYDSWQQAVDTAITNSGKTVKEVAIALWPHMKMESAYARFRNALNPTKDEKLTFDEIIFVCNFCEQYDPLYHFAQECNHTKPEHRAPADEQAELIRQFNSSASDLKKLADRIERLNEPRIKQVG